MSWLKVLENSGIIQILRNKLKTDEDRAAFDAALEEQVKHYSQLYESLNAKVMQYKADVEKLNVEDTKHRQPESEELPES